MPGFDGTGPRGMGPMTGRGAGYCAGYASSIPGRGFGMGRGWAMGGWGRGRGWRRQYYATGLPGWARYGYAPVWDAPPAYGPYAAPPPEQEVGFLKSQAEWLEKQLAGVMERLDQLEKEE